MGALLGLVVQGNANYNYLVDGTLVTPGLPVARDFVNHEGEFYVQDTWKLTRNFTVTGGIRLSLTPPVYEANGQQASTNIPLGDWLSKRAILADQGLSQTGARAGHLHPGGPGPAHVSLPQELGAASRAGLFAKRPIAGFPSSSSADRARLPSAPVPACITT